MLKYKMRTKHLVHSRNNNLLYVEVKYKLYVEVAVCVSSIYRSLGSRGYYEQPHVDGSNIFSNQNYESVNNNASVTMPEQYWRKLNEDISNAQNNYFENPKVLRSRLAELPTNIINVSIAIHVHQQY